MLSLAERNDCEQLAPLVSRTWLRVQGCAVHRHARNFLSGTELVQALLGVLLNHFPLHYSLVMDQEIDAY